MKINIYATPVSLAAFVVANVCDNVRQHHLQECLYYRIQEEGNCSRGCILLRDRFMFFGGWGWGRGKVWASMVGIFGWWRERRTFFVYVNIYMLVDVW